MSFPAAAPEIDRLSALAQSILTAIDTSAINLGATLPAKRIIAAGEAVHDCPQVNVTATGLQAGMPDAANTSGAFPTGGCQTIWTANFLLEIVQNAPLWPEDDQGVVAAKPINDWFIDFISPMSAVLLDAVNSLPTFGEKSFSLRYPTPSGGFAHIVGVLSLPLP